MLTPLEYYPDLPVFVIDLGTTATLKQRVEDAYVVQLPDRTWAAVAAENLARLH